MPKLKLDLSTLRVESFETTIRESSGVNGTVVAQSIFPTNITCTNCTVDWTSCPSDDGVCDCTQVVSTCFTSCNPDSGPYSDGGHQCTAHACGTIACCTDNCTQHCSHGCE